MSAPAWLMYRCRSCDLVFPACHVPDGPLALAVVEASSATPATWQGHLPGRLTIHHDCGDGRSTGLADLVGTKLDDEPDDDDKPDTDSEEDD